MMILSRLKMVEIKRYTPELKSQWDNLVSNSKNGTFLFLRDYMDYHSARFQDHSFLIYYKNKLEGVLPGNISDSVFYSHQGLTYGGLIITNKIRTDEVLETFKLVNQELKDSGIREVVYKPIPYIYSNYPSQEDLYALFLMNASRIGCNISSTIYQANKINFVESRKSGIRRSLKENIKVEEDSRFELFWPLLEDNLSGKYNKSPVHSLAEIKYLKSLFPGFIKLYLAFHNEDVVAGCVVFEMKHIVHTQYIAATGRGKELGALDFLFDVLINTRYVNFTVFDFGHSTEEMGKLLNENLIFQKEGFGGRGVVYEIYKYSLI
jgi:hypothetical protein